MQHSNNHHKLVIIGHRGAKGLAPENTLVGFQKAIECGVDQIETDVRLTSDGVLVLVHKHMSLPDGTTMKVADSTYQDILQHNPDVATLEQAIEFIDKRARLMIEVKKGVPTAPVVKVIKKFFANGWQASDFMFNSADYVILKVLYAALPEIDRIIQGNWSGMRVQHLARKLHTPYIMLDQRYVWWLYVYMVSKRFKLITYTYPWFESPKYNHYKALSWQKYGLYGVVTDYPDSFTASSRHK